MNIITRFLILLGITMLSINVLGSARSATKGIVPQCGISSIHEGRIVGGEEVIPHSLPWQVRLTNPSCGCGGTLISKRHVLTAAHCTTYDGMEIWVGQHTRDPQDGIPYKVCKSRPHPKYNRDAYAGYDIEILHLSQDVQLNEEVQIACLPTKEDGLDDAFLDRKNLTTSGWGDLYYGQHDCPNELRAVVLPGYSNERCEKNTGDYAGRIDWSSDRSNSIMCAGEAGKDACQGDSGGPLIYYNQGRATVVGVVSTGVGCGKAEYPGIFA